MTDEPSREIKQIMVRGLGPVSIDELIRLGPTTWEPLRNNITDHRDHKTRTGIAQCMMCGSDVYIQARNFKDEKLPLFSHHKGGDKSCPWYSADPISPNAARADQYGGLQTSPAHDLMCELVAELARLDQRCTSAKIEQYFRPETDEHGRYPDVLIRYEDRTDFAIEIQLALTFQTEISGRSTFYQRHGTALLWLLHDLKLDGGTIPQSFRDIIFRHRGNLFMLDREAAEESRRRGTLVLKCFLQEIDESFDSGRLVTLDELHIPEYGLPYFEDRYTPRLLAPAREARRKWWTALKATKGERLWGAIRKDPMKSAYALLVRDFPDLPQWLRDNELEAGTIIELLAVAFSVMSLAAGKFTNFVSREANATAMLNSKLRSKYFVPFARLIEELLTKSAASGLLETSVQRHLQQALAAGAGNFPLDSEPPAQILAHLFPEIFRPTARWTLEQLGELPSWAYPHHAESER